MRISDFELYFIELPRGAPHAPVRSLLVRILTAGGHEGWGEWCEVGQKGQPSEVRARLAPLLLGRNIFDVEELLRLPGLQPAPLRCAVEMACWDALGRALKQPLAHLWGGDYRRRIPLAVLVPQHQLTSAAQLARELVDQGFHTLVLRTSGNGPDDVARLAAVNEATKRRARLRFDAEAAFDTTSASELCRALATMPVEFVLDPIGRREQSALAELAAASEVPLAVSRGITSAARVLTVAPAQSVVHLVLEPAALGGLAATRQAALVAEAAGLEVSLRLPSATGIATAAMAQLSAATPALGQAAQCAYHELLDDVCAEPLIVNDGLLVPPQLPGLGVAVDRAQVERYAIASG